MSSHWQFVVLGIAASPLFACTLTSDDFRPVPVDSIPVEAASAAMPAAPPSCITGCDAPPTAEATDSVSPSESDSETPDTALPLSEPSPPASEPATAAPAPAPTTEMPPPAEMPPPVTEMPPPVVEPPVVPPPVVPEPEPQPPLPEPEPIPPPNPDLALIGWASVEGLGTVTTTGGAAGATVVATTPEELEDFATRPEPLTILIEGTLRLGRVDVASDKTLRGVGTAPRLEGGLRIRGRADAFVSNVIVQNLTVDAAFSEVEGDGVQIHYAHHVWVDHCEVRDAPDGNLDIVHGSDFVTVSFCRFAYGAGAAAGNRFSTQIGHSNSETAAAEDTGHLRVTFHHDFWEEGILGSMPNVRFGDVHVFNSFYASPGAESAITAALGSRLLVESNFFQDVAAAYGITAGASPAPQLRAVANVVTAPNPQLQEAGAAFVPPYPYVLEAAGAVPARVRATAGSTLELDPPNL